MRRALHFALDRPILVDVVKDVAPMRIGGFLYPFSSHATPPGELAKRLGYQAYTATAVKEARKLMEAVGYADGFKGLDFLVRDVSNFQLWSQAMQATLHETLNVQCTLRTVVESIRFDDIASGNFGLAIGVVVATPLDPSD